MRLGERFCLWAVKLINRMATITFDIRCKKCGLRSWEVVNYDMPTNRVTKIRIKCRACNSIRTYDYDRERQKWLKKKREEKAQRRKARKK